MPSKMLNPEEQWANKAEFKDMLTHLAQLYSQNFDKWVPHGASACRAEPGLVLTSVLLLCCSVAGGGVGSCLPGWYVMLLCCWPVNRAELGCSSQSGKARHVAGSCVGATSEGDACNVHCCQRERWCTL